MSFYVAGWTVSWVQYSGTGTVMQCSVEDLCVGWWYSGLLHIEWTAAIKWYMGKVFPCTEKFTDRSYNHLLIYLTTDLTFCHMLTAVHHPTGTTPTNHTAKSYSDLGNKKKCWGKCSRHKILWAQTRTKKIIVKAVKLMKMHAEVWEEDGKSIEIALQAPEENRLSHILGAEALCYWSLCNQSSCCSCWKEVSHSLLHWQCVEV